MKTKTLITEKEIARRIGRLAKDINKKYRNAQEPVIVVCVMRGALMFCADLLRELKFPVELDTVFASSYVGEKSSGKLQIKMDVQSKLKGRDVLIVEDIVDTGLTSGFLLKHMKAKGAKSVRLASLLSKPSTRKIKVKIDFVGFEIPDKFVFGYGLDVDGRYRELPKIKYAVK